MTPRIRKAAAVASSVALIGAAGIGVANAADTTSTGTTTTAAKGPGPGRGPGARSEELAAVAKTLGVTTAKLQAAVEAERPAKGERPKKDDDARAAEIAKALDVETAKVQTILEANRPTPPKAGDRPAAPKAGEKPPTPKAGEKPPAPKAGERPAGGPHGGRGPGGPRVDDAKLIAALAKGLSIDEAKVKTALAEVAAAHEKDHEAKDTARYAAIAKTLGLEATDVRKAFEAARPAKPAAKATATP